VWNSSHLGKGQSRLKLSGDDLTHVLPKGFCHFSPFDDEHLLNLHIFHCTRVHGRNFIECLILIYIDTVVIFTRKEIDFTINLEKYELF